MYLNHTRHVASKQGRHVINRPVIPFPFLIALEIKNYSSNFFCGIQSQAKCETNFLVLHWINTLELRFPPPSNSITRKNQRKIKKQIFNSSQDGIFPRLHCGFRCCLRIDCGIRQIPKYQIQKANWFSNSFAWVNFSRIKKRIKFYFA